MRTGPAPSVGFADSSPSRGSKAELRALPRLSFETPPAPARALGEAGKLEWIALSKLFIDGAYQREVTASGKKNIRRIVENFRWSRFSPLIVAARGGGRYAIIDGQHRALAALHHGAIPKVPCCVLACPGNEEAAAFATINGHVTRVSPLYMFRARLAAREPKAVAAHELAESVGAHISPYPVSAAEMKPGDTLAYGTIENSIERFGREVTAAALSLITMTGANTGLVKACLIEGFVDTLFANPEWLARIDEVRAAVKQKTVAALLAGALLDNAKGGRASPCGIAALPAAQSEARAGRHEDREDADRRGAADAAQVLCSRPREGRCETGREGRDRGLHGEAWRAQGGRRGIRQSDHAVRLAHSGVPHTGAIRAGEEPRPRSLHRGGKVG
ncbi:MAG TPA: DUF6551 family protein [Rhizomicrobium sp.]|jgi:hypothetical protein|nr:DUF6551 family protein [Rhizomicrobium sp.]